MGFTQSPAPPPVGGPSLHPGGSLPLSGLLFHMGDVLYDATMWRPWLIRVPAGLGLYTGHPWPQAHRG